MKKILISVSILAFVGVVVAQTTGAFFTDTETSSGSTFTSGTLELDINHNGSSAAWDLGLGNVVLNPGEETATSTILIGNSGSMPFAWFGYFSTGGNDAMLDNVYIKSAKMEFLNPSTGSWEETDQFIANGTGNVSGPDGHPWNSYYTNLANANGGVITLRAWNSAANNAMGVGGGVMKGALKPGYWYRFSFTLGMVDNADNSIQGQALSLQYTLTSTQVTQAATDALISADSRLSGDADITWMNTQLTHQGTVNI